MQVRNIVQGRHNSQSRPAVKEQNGIGFESGGDEGSLSEHSGRKIMFYRVILIVTKYNPYLVVKKINGFNKCFN